ncbi:lipase 3-like [Amphibalanus amphitrite]|uniref:lipase 3-like n=1 Tax=Amphibalanus amphitrite TaxID=1232801 RepID=UPI001C928459|nr:lipase 3-like [Amphibalanus amphitrite]
MNLSLPVARWTLSLYLLAMLMACADCRRAPQAKRNKLYQTVPEIIAAHGYPVEVHHVQTADGYILEMHRIPGGRGGSQATSPPGRPVLVLHGVQDSSAGWVINPRKSLGFVLADEGYDVWLGNNRGNTYGRAHVTLNPNKRRFWEFTLDSFSKYDNPAMIDYILETTGYDDLYYIGFSSSTISFWAMMNYYPAYNDKVRFMVALGPVATMKYFRSIVRIFVPFRKAIQKMSAIFSHNESFRHKPLYGVLGKIFCSKHSPTVPLCALGMFMLAGWDPKQLDKASLPVIFSHVPAGTGSLVMEQVSQYIASGRFQRYDYGKKQNLVRYGQRRPPEYFPEKVTAPVVLIWGPNDKMADKRDAALLAARLPNLVRSEPVNWRLWQHLDFMWGIDANRLVYSRVIHYMEQFGGAR